VTLALFCAGACGQSLEGGRPDRRYLDGAHRVRAMRLQRNGDGVRKRAGDAKHRPRAMQPTVSLSSFDRVKVDAINACGEPAAPGVFAYLASGIVLIGFQLIHGDAHPIWPISRQRATAEAKEANHERRIR
jgi:hypothetical protein